MSKAEKAAVVLSAGQHDSRRDGEADWIGLDAPLEPGKCIGILGGGQLGRMLAGAASRLGFKVAIYSDAPENPAFSVSDASTIGDYQDFTALETFSKTVDVLTYEFENVPVAAAQHLATRLPVRPGPRVLEIAQDRLAEKTFISGLGIPVAPFADITDADQLSEKLEEFGAGILKTRRLGYDGKGQARLKSKDEVAGAFADMADQACLLEKLVAFEAELSVLVVRSGSGEMRCYDCPRNDHSGGILRRSTVPNGLPSEVNAEANAIACRIADALSYVGVLGVELFYVGPDATNGQSLIVNEIAPRVHNSGHWTQDACYCDQFENHIRAVAGWPLGDTTRHSDVEMHNLIGDEVSNWFDLAAEPSTCVHLYGKDEARAGRKMGHINRVAPPSILPPGPRPRDA